MLPNRILGPSAHQIGPSPSQTATGVQMNAALAASVIKLILRVFPSNTSAKPCPVVLTHTRRPHPIATSKPGSKVC